jgi:hypothetical protein
LTTNRNASAKIPINFARVIAVNSNEEMFGVSGKLIRIMPRAGASLRNPDLGMPVLKTGEDGNYLEMTIDADAEDATEVEVTRRIPLRGFSKEEWEILKSEYAKLNLELCRQEGLKSALEKIADIKIRRLFETLLTFLDFRQVGVVLFLYREAARQGNSREVRFRSNDLLEALGYARDAKGRFHTDSRSQLNQDLVALHRMELVFARSVWDGKNRGAEVVVKTVLRIQKYLINKLQRPFDLDTAADYTHQLADEYTVELGFYPNGPLDDIVLLPETIDIKQNERNKSEKEYELKLLIYLMNRMQWDKLKNNDILTISKQYLYKNMDLLGSNISRNNRIFWRTVDALREKNYIIKVQEITGKRRVVNFEFQVNPEMIRNAQMSTKIV